MEVPAADRWDGTGWSVQTPAANPVTANPGGSYLSHLQGVACPSSDLCTAVDDQPGGTLTERWDQSGWAVQASPNPAGASYSRLQGIACPSAEICIAVGDYRGASADFALVERWGGRHWTIQTTPLPNGALSTTLSAVSCASASTCTAVGSYENGVGTGTLAERWDGKHWTIQTTPNPPGAQFAQFSGVSCPSARTCIAVGYAVNSGQEQVPLAERWDGTRWMLEAARKPFGQHSAELQAVSCTSNRACTAVGNTLAERWDGSGWRIQPTGKAVDVSADLQGVSCAFPDSCTAVGSYEGVNGELGPFALGWNGTDWVTQAATNQRGTGAGLVAVSCPSAITCTAVGHYVTNDVEFALAERRYRGTWTTELTRSPTRADLHPSGSASSELLGVSCTTATACSGVGYYTNRAGHELTMVESSGK
jgi:hypothetical protein